MHRDNELTRFWWCLLAVVALATFGCGGKASRETYFTHYHGAGWISAHPGAGAASPQDCATCHEFTVLKQGGAVPSCMTAGCHHVTVAGWPDLTVHGARAKAALDATGGSFASCAACHGAGFTGAGTGVSCFTCHGVNAPHSPAPWRGVGASTHVTTDPSNAPACARCHLAGSPNNPANHPPAPAAPGASPGCFNNTLCHGGGGTIAHTTSFLLTVHPTTTQGGFDGSCSSCHAVSGTAPNAAAPACMVCHAAGDPLVVSNGPGTCLSCHASGPSGLPSGPSGAYPNYPNIEGAHAEHMALAGVTCGACHTGYGTGSAGHYNSANARSAAPAAPGTVAFVAGTYNTPAAAPSFSASASAFTCSNVSCHGGQTTPGWQQGALASATACTSCHQVGGTQYNRAASGAHAFHMALSGAPTVTCTTCHNMAPGTSTGATNHFAALATQALEGPAPTTVVPAGNTTPYGTTATCTLSCHGSSHTSRSWFGGGGASHAIPFTASAHTGATTTSFNADCSACHDATGASTKSGPTCTTCHAASPLATAPGSCLSCHTTSPAGMPQGPSGGPFPNLEGAHAEHLALPTALTCATCHTGYESGSLGHYNAANARTAAPMAPSPVAFASPNPFQAESGASSVTSNASAFTCSNISCHGGQTTPGWQSGTLATLSACTSCHARGTSQYNSYNSGEHEKHVVEEGVACTSCHTMANATGHPRATNHFDNLNTPVMDGPASDTIVPVGGVYTPGGTPGNGGCTTTCHEPESW